MVSLFGIKIFPSSGKPEKLQTDAKSLFDLTVNSIRGEPVSLSTYSGRVLLVSNVASFCGYTAGHYKGFGELYLQFPENFEVLAFPCGQFMAQEYSDKDQICDFASKKAFKGVLFDKVDVNGSKASPVFDFLKVNSGDTRPISWNFNCFLLRPDGTVYKRYDSKVAPKDMVSDIQFLMEELKSGKYKELADATAAAQKAKEEQEQKTEAGASAPQVQPAGVSEPEAAPAAAAAVPASS